MKKWWLLIVCSSVAMCLALLPVLLARLSGDEDGGLGDRGGAGGSATTGLRESDLSGVDRGPVSAVMHGGPREKLSPTRVAELRSRLLVETAGAEAQESRFSDKVGVLLAHLNASVTGFEDLRALLDAVEVPVDEKKLIAAAFGRSDSRQAHSELLKLAAKKEVPSSLRCTAVSALGQQRRDAPRGTYLYLSGPTAYGFRVTEPELVASLLELLREGLRPDEDVSAGAVRNRLAQVLSGNIDDPLVARALLEALDEGPGPARSTILNALASSVCVVLPGSREILEGVLRDAVAGTDLGAASGALLQAKGQEAHAQIEGAFRAALKWARGDSDRQRSVGLCVSQVTSHIKLREEHHAWWRRVSAANIAVERPHWGGELHLALILAVACTADGDLKAPESATVLELLGDSRRCDRLKLGVVQALQPHRLSRSAAEKVCACLTRGFPFEKHATLVRIAMVMSTARSVTDRDMLEWAAQLDGLSGTSDIAEAVRNSRARMAQSKHE